ncbi:MAG: hypothetical protein QOJ79_1423 [Actinomycetota bacterium]|nr:hypothetical protein [Actinomycetota bacterium]
MTGPLLDRGEIETLLAALGERCAANGIQVEMFRVGGAAMALAYSRERATRDLDAIFEPKTLVYEQAGRLAEERGLPPDWLNDSVKGLLPDRPDAGAQVTFSRPGISVVVASAEYLFAMKAAAARQEADSEDLLSLAALLHISTAAEAFSMIERFYAPSRLSAKSQFFIEGAFAGDA